MSDWPSDAEIDAFCAAIRPDRYAKLVAGVLKRFSGEGGVYWSLGRSVIDGQPSLLIDGKVYLSEEEYDAIVRLCEGDA